MWIQELVNCLEGATLKHPRTEEVIALKQPHLPKRIYKYRCDSTYARANLKTDTAWMASPDTYNDPYDCSFQVAEDVVVAALKMSLLWEFAKIYKFPHDQVIAVVDKALSSGLDPLTSLAASIAEAQGVAPGSNPPVGRVFLVRGSQNDCRHNRRAAAVAKDQVTSYLPFKSCSLRREIENVPRRFSPFCIFELQNQTTLLSDEFAKRSASLRHVELLLA